MAETARRNGFRTQAEEDRANDVAIAQALAELMDEDQNKKPQQTHTASSSRLTKSSATNRTAPAARSRLVAMMEQGSRRQQKENTASNNVSRNGAGSNSTSSAGWPTQEQHSTANGDRPHIAVGKATMTTKRPVT
ncbi:hypothetical protein NLG97_g10141 [Lecanicillium saksenae]|uniref:Uncharacterized protein n=1 Tax=Lecanicillium saksenae TaxID=468837 RepID=A0ACC1QEJ2_9HYPO|nr:hypothetical protein NLG97_g10141 [Lecanicillium saksenae]